MRSIGIRSVGVALAAVTALLVAPGFAGAANVALWNVGADHVLLQSLGDERNAVTIDLRGRELLVHDSAAPLVAMTGCESIDAHTVRCLSDFIGDMAVKLGGGDDTFLARSAPQHLGVDGGPGEDDLRQVGPTRDPTSATGLSGGPGNDHIAAGSDGTSLLGGQGNDVMIGGPGHDAFDGGEGADLIDGGPGRDRAWTSAPVGGRIDLRFGSLVDRDGVDTLSNVESGGLVHGGTLIGTAGHDSLVSSGGVPGETAVMFGLDGDDWILGSDADDLLVGGAGADKLRGEGGVDRIDGGDGPDRIELGRGHVRGGTGDDAVEADGEASVDCGPGQDRLWAYAAIVTARSCETVRVYDRLTTRLPSHAIGGRLTVPVVPNALRAGCIVARLTARGRILASVNLFRRGRRLLSATLPAHGGRPRHLTLRVLVTPACRGYDGIFGYDDPIAVGFDVR